jgi:hypothetical protein
MHRESVLELEAIWYKCRCGMAFGLLNKIKTSIKCWCCPG